MHTSRELPPLTSSGHPLETGPDALGELPDASGLLHDPAELNRRMNAGGYLLLRNLLDRDEVLTARRSIAHRFAGERLLQPGTDPIDCIAAQIARAGVRPDLAKDNPDLHRVLYSGRMIAFFEHFLGEPVRHFDYTWFRAIPPGSGTPPHCDIVYMGRGERHRLYTAWTPIGDIDYAQGGLMILENSIHNERLRETYCQSDVDAVCTNRTGLAARDHFGPGRSNGHLGRNPPHLRRQLGGRWLTTEYRAGDVLVFSVYTVHASLDNHSNRIRLSSDSRYQPASTPADERWIGPNPLAHGPRAKRNLIC